MNPNFNNKFLCVCATIACFCALSLQTTAQAELACSADIDGDGQVTALTDGLLNIRYLLGLRGKALTRNALGQNATQTNPHQIAAYLSSKECNKLFDIDNSMTNGDNHPDALSDGLLFIRFLFGLRDQSLINGILQNGATIRSSEATSASITKIVEQAQNPTDPGNTIMELCVDDNPCFETIEINGEIST